WVPPSGSSRIHSVRSNRRWCWRARPSRRTPWARKASRASAPSSRSASRSFPRRARAESTPFAMKSWFFFVLVAALALIAVRIYAKLRVAQKSRAESWDEQVIMRLRSQGYAPFNDYRVDFFLALPDEAACQGARARLEPEFSVDVKALENDPELNY